MRVFDRFEQMPTEEAEGESGPGPAARVFWISALAASALAILTIYGGALLRAPVDPVAAKNAAFSDLIKLTERGAQR